MGAIADIFRTFAPDYVARYPGLPPQHKKVIDAILACRTGELGSAVYACTECGTTHSVHRSCGNRHCPQCQAHKTRLWLNSQLDRKLPGPHFLLTFTLPEPLRPVVRSHQRVGYDALFDSSSHAIKKLARDPRLLGSDLPGFSGVLHTWGRPMHYHPHIHYIVPAGGLSPDRQYWIPSRSDFYLPVQALSPIYRAFFKKRMRRAGLLSAIDPAVWNMDWVVHCEPAGDGVNAFKYLARYVFRVAISDQRIVSFSPEERTVSFRYQPHDAEQEVTTTVPAFEFLRRYLQHVLPSGFMKVRHFGFLNPNCAVPLEETRRLVTEATGFTLPPEEPPLQRPVFFCPDCGATLVLFRRIPPLAREPPDTG